MKSRLHMHVVQSDSDKMQLAESSGPQVVNSDLSPVCVANEFEDMNNMEMQARSKTVNIDSSVDGQNRAR